MSKDYKFSTRDLVSIVISPIGLIFMILYGTPIIFHNYFQGSLHTTGLILGIIGVSGLIWLVVLSACGVTAKFVDLKLKENDSKQL